jgi:hypothetical protein
VTLKPKAEIDGVRLLASLTFEGHGPAVLPATAVPGWLRDWVCVAVTGLPRRRIGVAQRRTGMLAAPARAVHELLAAVLDGADQHHLPAGVHPPSSQAPTSEAAPPASPGARRSGEGRARPRPAPRR